MAAWGVITIGMGLTQSFGGLVACRFLLGVFESGFFPGCAYLISMSVVSVIFTCPSLVAENLTNLERN